MKIDALIYRCPKCNRRFEMHIHTPFYERKALYCARDGELMRCSHNSIKVELRGSKNAACKA